MKAHDDARDTRTVTVRLLAEIAETEVRSIRADQRLREDLGLDSLQSLELLSCIGEALKIDLDVEEAMGIRTVDDACDFVARQYAEQRRDGQRRN
jgi:acyl carrier protein